MSGNTTEGAILTLSACLWPGSYLEPKELDVSDPPQAHCVCATGRGVAAWRLAVEGDSHSPAVGDPVIPELCVCVWGGLESDAWGCLERSTPWCNGRMSQDDETQAGSYK